MPELFPMIQPQLREVEEQPLPPAKEVAWDFDRGQPVFRRGKPVTVTGKEAVKVWCWLALMTERTRYPIFSWLFGEEVTTLIGQNYTGELKAAEARRYVWDALIVSPYVTAVTNIQVEFSKGDLAISSRVHTVYGEVDMIVPG